MVHSPRVGVTPFLVFTMAFLMGSCGGNQTPSQPEVESQLLESLRQAVEASRPIENTDALLKTLRLPPDRAAAITVGPEARQAIAERLRPQRLDFICIGGACVCAGDPDCNDMFSGVCRDPGTNGSCTDFNGTVICYCTP